jgi:hypothetical protein
MKTKRGKKALLGISIVIVAVGLLTSEAFPWGWAVHTYIDDHLGTNRKLRNMNEIYGGMAPDVFNYIFSYLPFLSNQTHGDYETGESHFMKARDAVKGELQKSLAFGFVSHNDLWGADFTAHHQCMTCGPALEKGYVIAKAEELQPILLSVLESYGILLDPDDVLDIAHEMTEAGVDLLVKRTLEPRIGEKIVSSSLLRSPKFPLLLVKAFAEDLAEDAGINRFEAARIIVSAEREFRKSMILYGTALNQDEATALKLISEQLATVAEGFLAANGVDLDELGDFDLVPLIEFAIGKSMEICADDFADELKKTTTFVGKQLKIHGVSYD